MNVKNRAQLHNLGAGAEIKRNLKSFRENVGSIRAKLGKCDKDQLFVLKISKGNSCINLQCIIFISKV